MAHGSKRWIVDCMGRRRRSTDRTVVDFWRPIRNVEPDGKYNGARWRTKKAEKAFCPQCRQVAKVPFEQQKLNRKNSRNLHKEYETLYGEALRQWAAWSQEPVTFDNAGLPKYRSLPKIPKPPEWYEWASKQVRPPQPWQFNERSFMCPKHKHIDELKELMYNSPWPGNTHYRQSYRRDEIRHHRAAVRNAMQNGYYDDIPVFHDRKLWW
jgi:hypothetical protein